MLQRSLLVIFTLCYFSEALAQMRKQGQNVFKDSLDGAFDFSNFLLEVNEFVDHYSVQMKGKNSSYEALYDAGGKLLMSKKVEKDVALPQPVLQAVAKEYPGVTLKKDQHTKLTEHGKMKDYYVSLANGKKVTYATDGTSIKK